MVRHPMVRQMNRAQRRRVAVSAFALAFVCAGEAALAAAPPSAPAVAARPWDDRSLPAEKRAELMVDAMTLEEQISLLRPLYGLSLADLGFPLPPGAPAWMKAPKPDGALGSAAYAPAIARLGWPALQETNAGLGVTTMSPTDEATALPSSVALAASFDLDLSRADGMVIGAEAHAKGFNVELAGGVDLARDPRNGRNFEYAGEDPLLAGLIVGQNIAGLQSRHVVSTVKHFAVNDQETGRKVLDARIDEAGLRESDLLAFQIAIETGRPGSVLCANNKVNGAYACENSFLVKRVLKGDWRYPGWVMSDWGSVYDLKRSVQAGLDQQSPQEGAPDYFAGLSDAVARGEIPRAQVRDMAFRIVRALFETGVIDDPPAPGGAIDKAADAAVAERVAEKGMVLLKNDGLLPLVASARRIAVIGGHADIGVLQGGGSAQVTPYGGFYRDAAGMRGIMALLAPTYGLSSPLKALQAARPGAQFVFDDGSDPARAAAVARSADVALVFAVQPETEALDLPDLSLPHGQDALIQAVAAANPRTGVVLETGGPVLMPWLSTVQAVIEAWYPGQRGGEAIARVLTGAAEPSGRLPMTFPASADQLPRPKLDGLDPAHPANLLGPPPAPFVVDYKEGSDVGYRWFEKTGAKPLFPFGYGLTYSRFAYAGLKIKGGEDLTVRFQLTNRGEREASETAQLYVAPPGRTHRLAGWMRVTLKPGETRELEIVADPRLLADYDAKAGRWMRPAGGYDVVVGPAAGDNDLHAVGRLTAKTN